MSHEVSAVSETTPIHHIAALLNAKKIKRVPVIADGKVVGIVSRADILHSIVASAPDDSASSDEAIRLAVSTRLCRELNLDPARVSVTVSNGDAHLWGQVSSEAERKAAYIVAETVNGVRGIINDLRAVTDTPSVVEAAVH